MGRNIKDKKGVLLRLGDVLKEIIVGESNEELGHIITQVVKSKGSYFRKVLADGEGLAFTRKGAMCSIEQNIGKVEIIGSNYGASLVNIETELE